MLTVKLLIVDGFMLLSNAIVTAEFWSTPCAFKVGVKEITVGCATQRPEKKNINAEMYMHLFMIPSFNGKNI